MIGNVSKAMTNEDLNSLISIRLGFKHSYAKKLKEIGVDYKVPKCKIIVIDDIVISEDDYIGGSILLPDARTMDLLINGDYINFSNQYHQKLLNDENIKEYLIILLTGLMEKGFDYILYFNSMDFSLSQTISQSLCQFLENTIGLIIYPIEAIKNYPNLLLEQSINVNYIQQNKLAIDSYGYSVKQPNLFQQF